MQPRKFALFLIIITGLSMQLCVPQLIERNPTEHFTKKVESFNNIPKASLSPFQPNGTVVCNATNTQQNPLSCTDGDGGMYLVWIDYRSGSSDIYMQHISKNGAMLWNANGIGICNATNMQSSVRIVSDEMGGCFIAWVDRRTGTDDVYAQYIDSSGTIK